MAIQNFTGYVVVVEKCVYKPEWSSWEKLLVVDTGQTMGASDAWWEFSTYDTAELALAARPEFTTINNYEEMLMISGKLVLNRPI